MTQKSKAVDLELIQKKLRDRLGPSGWGILLGDFILSEEFNAVLKQLYQESVEGKRFTPPLKQLFRAFEECPVTSLKVVVVGQDPYPMQGQADGIAFSCGNTKKAAVSLKYIFGEVENYYRSSGVENMDEIKDNFNPDLTRWANQGVLMLNTALTTTVGKIGSHYDIWKPLMKVLFEKLSQKKGLIYVFLGKKAQEYMGSVKDDVNYKISTTHPAYAAYTKSKTWESGDVFGMVNKILAANNDPLITW